jgi:acyl carrier protein
MTNKEKYAQVFIDSFLITADQLNENLVYQSVQQWDSIGHMGMVAALEEVFDIMLETDDIIDFGSYAKGIEILAKYNVVI